MSFLSRRQSLVTLGLLLLLCGGFLRAVESATLTPSASRILTDITPHRTTRLEQTPLRKTIQPPPWIGWMLLSFGVVFVASGLRPNLTPP